VETCNAPKHLNQNHAKPKSRGQGISLAPSQCPTGTAGFISPQRHQWFKPTPAEAT
jgi:hypothetical protein